MHLVHKTNAKNLSMAFLVMSLSWCTQKQQRPNVPLEGLNQRDTFRQVRWYSNHFGALV